jgi:hypothetical protein
MVVIPLYLYAYFFPQLLVAFMLIINNPLSLGDVDLFNQVFMIDEVCIIIPRHVKLELRGAKGQMLRSIHGDVIIYNEINHELIPVIIAFFHLIRGHAMLAVFAIHLIVSSLIVHDEGLTSADYLSLALIILFVVIYIGDAEGTLRY